MVWTTSTVETSPHSINLSLIQRFRKTVQSYALMMSCCRRLILSEASPCLSRIRLWKLCLCQAAMQLSDGVYSTWILCLYSTFEEIPICLHDMYMPSCLSEKYLTRAVHDAAEFQMEKPSNPDVQAATWSH